MVAIINLPGLGQDLLTACAQLARHAEMLPLPQASLLEESLEQLHLSTTPQLTALHAQRLLPGRKLSPEKANNNKKGQAHRNRISL